MDTCREWKKTTKLRAIVDMRVPGKRPRGDEDGVNGLRHAGTADHPRGCPGQNIL